MPSSINGIGTRYFLKRNRQFEETQCPHCHNRVKLESYETWYCVCVVFIPVLPLGKRQVLNFCPLCTRHQVIKFREWEKIRQEAISETSDEFAEAKSDPEAAIKMHGTLLAFQKSAEAERFAEIMLDRFGTVPQVQFYLGACFERTGKGERANACFLRAYELAPQELSYRRAAALVLMEQKKPDEAKPLLDVFGPDSPDFQMPLFFILGKSYQDLGRHAEAIEVFQRLLEKQPGLAIDKNFAKALRTSERALGIEKSTLPPDPWFRKKGLVWGLVACAVVVALCGWNYYIFQHRTLHVVNGLNSPITVQIDGLPAIRIEGNSRRQIIVAEGSHEAQVTEPAGRFDASQFELRSAWWERFFRSPVFISDPTQTASIDWEETVYADANAARGDQNKYEFRLGHRFSYFPHVDYPFEPFPQQLKAKQGSRITKTRVGMVHLPPTTAVGQAFELKQDLVHVDDFIEHHLTANPEDGDLLNAYIAIGMMQGAFDRHQKFIESQLLERPVRISWHRRYQDLTNSFMTEGDPRVRYEALVAKYDEWLKQSPQDASLIYLRGRLEPQARQSIAFMDRALVLDPQHAHAMAAKGFVLLVQGQRQESLEWYRKAAALRPNDQEFSDGLSNSQLAAGDFETLEKSIREKLKTAPDDLVVNLGLFNLLIRTGRADEAEREYQTFLGRLQQPGGAVLIGYLLKRLELPYLYAKGDFENLATKAKQAGPDGAEFEFFASLERGQLADVPQSSLPLLEPYWQMCRALVAAQSGNVAEQTASKAAALAIMERKGDEEGIAAQLLLQGPNAKWEEVEGLMIRPRFKTIFLTLLAQEAPHLRTQCLDLAEQLNCSLEFPYYLIRSNIARLRK